MLIQENTLSSHKNLYVKRYSSFSHNFQKLETTKMFFTKEGINILQYPHTVEYYSVKMNKPLICAI